MAKVLYIKANPKTDEQSNTFQLANHFIEEYKKHQVNDEVVVLDLYKEQIKPLDGEMLHKMFSGEENIMMKYAKQFTEFDKYILAAPMWNLSIPAILKAYFDYVTYVGITFKYTVQGPIGLLKNKKALHVVTRGGNYEGTGANYEFGDKYVRGLLGFLGVSDVTTLNLDNTNVLMGEALEQAKKQATEKARELAATF